MSTPINPRCQQRINPAGVYRTALTSVILNAMDAKTVPCETSCAQTPLLPLTERNEQITAALEQRYDALNQYLISAEGVLKGLKPPHAVWVWYGELDGQYQVLGMCKVADQWRLVHGTDHEGNSDGGIFDVKPLADCPIYTRVQACKQLTELHKKIIEAKEKYLPEVDAAIREVAQFCLTHAPVKSKSGKK